MSQSRNIHPCAEEVQPLSMGEKIDFKSDRQVQEKIILLSIDILSHTHTVQSSDYDFSSL